VHEQHGGKSNDRHRVVSEQTASTMVKTTAAELPEIVDPVMECIAGDEPLTFELWVPQRAAVEPPGVLVYISPKPGAGLPAAWATVLEELNLVWVGANDSGNEVAVVRRVALCLLSRHVATQHLARASIDAIDESRVYLSGFSGGGRVASMVIPHYPQLFAGVVFVCGANPTGPLQPGQLANHRFVFLTGTEDFNLMDMQMAFSVSQNAGIGASALYVVDGLEHALPEAAALRQALRFVDGDDGAIEGEPGAG
jgi:hypothetical protein